MLTMNPSPLRPDRAPPRKLSLLGFEVDNVPMREGIEEVTRRLAGNRAFHVAFLNAHYANVAHGNSQYREALGAADCLFADGVGLRLAARLAGREIRENVNGTDMFPRLCAALEGTERRVFLLGGRPGVAESVRDWVSRHHPTVQVCGVRHGYFSEEEREAVLDQISSATPDLILVAMGAPFQEIWIRRNMNRTGAKVVMGVGGLFDFFSGQVPRAPAWVRRLGAEWVFRLIQEPGRLWKRYLIGNLTFLWRAFLWARIESRTGMNMEVAG
jgi:N-acetylglucosaminyldiphosphoundecaprenol N-acetyl-beta-D-mannosaminyltransferase